MPIHCPIATQRITQDEFKQIAGEVMQHVFTIHNEFGRFFDEQIYTKERVDRMDGVELKVPVTATHDWRKAAYRKPTDENGRSECRFQNHCAADWASLNRMRSENS